MTSKARFAITAGAVSVLTTIAFATTATTAPAASALPGAGSRAIESTPRAECLKKCGEESQKYQKECQKDPCKTACPDLKNPNDTCSACMKPCLKPHLTELNECVRKCG